jgi:uncharacterized membrane protein YqjE
MALRQNVGQLASTLGAMVRTRLELFSLELAEQRSRVLRLFILTVAGALCLTLALLVFSLMVVLFFWPTEYRYVALALLVVAYLVAAGVLFFKVRQSLLNDPQPFSATLDELRRDVALIDRLRDAPSSRSSSEAS